MVTLASPFETDAPRTRFSRHDSRFVAKSAQRFRGALAYDVKGNLVARPASLQSPALSLVWDFDNKLRGADTNGTPATLEVTYEYDALGRRVARSGPGGNVVYFQAGQQTIADYPRGGAPASATYRYVYGAYIDEPLLRETVSGSVRHFFHRNQQYSVTTLTDSAGNTAERYAYTAYGTLTVFNSSGTPQATSPLNNRYTYTGREWDNVLKLHFFRARWYDAVAGRFIGRDPGGMIDGLNLFLGYFKLQDLDPSGNQVIAETQVRPSVRPSVLPLRVYNPDRYSRRAVSEEISALDLMHSPHRPFDNPYQMEYYGYEQFEHIRFKNWIKKNRDNAASISEAVSEARERGVSELQIQQIAGGMLSAINSGTIGEKNPITDPLKVYSTCARLKREPTHRERCQYLWGSYKNAQDQFEKMTCKNATTCAELARAVFYLLNEIEFRNHYINLKCDEKILWNPPNPNTAKHPGELDTKINKTLPNCMGRVVGDRNNGLRRDLEDFASHFNGFARQQKLPGDNRRVIPPYK